MDLMKHPEGEEALELREEYNWLPVMEPREPSERSPPAGFEEDVVVVSDMLSDCFCVFIAHDFIL